MWCSQFLYRIMIKVVAGRKKCTATPIPLAEAAQEPKKTGQQKHMHPQKHPQILLPPTPTNPPQPPTRHEPSQEEPPPCDVTRATTRHTSQHTPKTRLQNLQSTLRTPSGTPKTRTMGAVLAIHPRSTAHHLNSLRKWP